MPSRRSDSDKRMTFPGACDVRFKVGLMLCEIGLNRTRLADLCQIARGHRLMMRARVRQKTYGKLGQLACVTDGRITGRLAIRTG